MEVFISRDQIFEKVNDLAAQIKTDYENENPLLVGALKGSFIMMSDLVRALDIPLEVDFLSVSSYGAETESSGRIELRQDLKTSVENRHVLLVEDIVDTGHTLDYILRNFAARKPASVRVATLLNKPSRREVEVPVDFIGFEVPNEFVLGYGLDFVEQYRNIPFIGVLKPEVYQNAIDEE